LPRWMTDHRRALARERDRRRRARARATMVSLRINVDRLALHAALRVWRFIGDAAEDHAETLALAGGVEAFLSYALTRGEGDF
jgi:hypothetical protein